MVVYILGLSCRNKSRSRKNWFRVFEDEGQSLGNYFNEELARHFRLNSHESTKLRGSHINLVGPM